MPRCIVIVMVSAVLFTPVVFSANGAEAYLETEITCVHPSLENRFVVMVRFVVESIITPANEALVFGYSETSGFVSLNYYFHS